MGKIKQLIGLCETKNCFRLATIDMDIKVNGEVVKTKSVCSKCAFEFVNVASQIRGVKNDSCN